MFNKWQSEKTEVSNLNIGKNISALRKERNMTQEDLAKALGVSAQAVSKWENENSCPDISLLTKIADLFGVTVDELLRNDTGQICSKTAAQSLENKSANKKLNITVEQPNGKKTSINIPFGLVNLGVKIGGAFGLGKDIAEQISATVNSAEFTEKEVISIDGENGEHITISVI